MDSNVIGSTFDHLGAKLKQPLLKDIDGTKIETGVDIFNLFWSDSLEAAWGEWEEYIKDIIKNNNQTNNNNTENKNAQHDPTP